MDVTIERVWALVDELVEKGLGPAAVDVMQQLIKVDPEGAARRASGKPQYDHDRGRAYDQYLLMLEAHGGGEPAEEQPQQEPQAPPEPWWPVDPSYNRPDTEPANPDDFALAAPAALVDCE